MKRTNTPGRKPTYRDDMPHRVYKLCLLGLTDEDLAVAFGVNVNTIHYWKRHYPDFGRAVLAGRDEADTEVAHSLFREATGYEYTEHHTVQRTGKDNYKLHRTVTRQVRPNVRAIMYWLNNRQRARWADVQRTEHSGTITHTHDTPLDLTDLTTEERKLLRGITKKRLLNNVVSNN